MSAKITFIGAGNMASSLASGIIAKGYDPVLITLCDPNVEALQRARSTLQVNTGRDNSAACKKADIVILAVKPQVLMEVLAPLQEILAKRKPLVISIAAGISLSKLEACLGPDVPLVRCMPNTPAMVETGATGMYANRQVSEKLKDLTKSILSSVGLALWLDNEDQIDAVTAVSGSGPAYFFKMIENMIAAGTELGLSETVARQLTLQTALGSAQMAITSATSPSTLREQVTSPGGTTERALHIMDEHNFGAGINAAVKGAYQRSKELSK